MKITRNDPQWAASQALITSRQAYEVWTGLERHLADQTDTGGPEPGPSHRHN